MDGKQLFRLTAQKLSTLCDDADLGMLLYKKLRHEAKKVEAQKERRVADNKQVAHNSKIERW
jgi:hypothetical protein